MQILVYKTRIYTHRWELIYTKQSNKASWATANKTLIVASALSYMRDFTYPHCHRGMRMRDALRRRREGWHAAVDAAGEEGVEAVAVVADMDQLGEMARWRRKGDRYGKRYAGICLEWWPVRYLNAACLGRNEATYYRLACKHAESPTCSLSLFCR